MSALGPRLALLALTALSPALALGDAPPQRSARTTAPVEPRAPGSPLLGEAALEPGDRARLAVDAARGRATDPAAFGALDELERGLRALGPSRDGGYGVTARLRRLGARALLPMIARLALTGPTGVELDEPRRLALTVGLLEALGALRDERARPVFEAAAKLEDAPLDVLRAAAGALARLAADRDLARLDRLARSGGPRRLVAIQALGSCRRLATVAVLEARLSAATDEPTARAVVRALGDVGNAWAWITPRRAASGEAGATRAAARRALASARSAWPTLAPEIERSAWLVDPPPEAARARGAR